MITGPSGMLTRHPGLGRIAAPDSRDHKMRALLMPRIGELPSYKYWTPGAVLDQGSTSSCVGHAWSGFLAGSPIRTKTGPSPFTIYDNAQLMDEWPGTSYDGTSVRAGAKYLQSLGRLGEYVFETDLNIIKRWLLTTGPIVLGTEWHQNMFDADAKGYVHLGGGVAGGHAYLCYGYGQVRKAFRCRNSWGPNFAESGNFWIRDADMAALMLADGEACAALEILP